MGIDPLKPRPAVFLDRDGVINRAIVRDGKPYPPDRIEDLELLPGVGDALERLKAAGFDLVVVTNQPDVARGRQAAEVVNAMHDRLAALLPIDEFRVCWHDDNDACDCRKPKPGLITRPPLHDLHRSVVVGDRWRDIEAGRSAGCRAAILVDYGYDEGPPVTPDARVRSLAEAADWILSTMVNA
jgi:D-glycero-D-manno-heptose 1,7-bisphosphate phosphatase